MALRGKQTGVRRVLGIAIVAVLLSAAPGGPAASAAAQSARSEPHRTARCDEPRGGWDTAKPKAVGLDGARLEEAFDFAQPRLTAAIAVFRHGCLVAERIWRGANEETWHESYSMAKSVTAMATGRAITLGLLGLDDLIGRYVRKADKTHSRITVEELLTMSSGLHWNFFRDYNVFTPRDRVRDALTLPFDHEPGTFFEYAQSPVTLLAKVVGNAAGMDFQRFVQRELFGPIGIGRDSWEWTRDAKGNTQAFWGLNMRIHDFARLGELMRRGGVWNDRRLIDASFVRAAVSPSKTNGGYGHLFWLNNRTNGFAPTVYSRHEGKGPAIKSAPTGMYFMAGLQDQRVYVIPSLDMVIVRVGGSGSREPDTRSMIFTSAPGEFEHELFRLLMKAVLDRQIRDPGPYEYHDPVPPLDPEYGILKSAREPDHLVETVRPPD